MKLKIIIGVIVLLVLVGVIVYQTLNHEDKAVAVQQYSAPIGPQQDGSILLSTSLITTEAQG